MAFPTKTVPNQKYALLIAKVKEKSLTKG